LGGKKGNDDTLSPFEKDAGDPSLDQNNELLQQQIQGTLDSYLMQ